MLWRGSGRWSTNHASPQVLFRVLVLHFARAPRPWLLQSVRGVHAAAATAAVKDSHRQNADTSATRRMKQSVKNIRGNKQKASPKPSTAGLDGPRGLLALLGKGKVLVTRSPQDTVHQETIQWARWSAFLTDGEAVCHLAEQLAHTDAPHRICRLLHAAHAVGACFKQNVFERIVFQLSEVKQWGLVLLVVAAGFRSTRKSSVRLLNWRGRALVEMQHFTQLDALLGEFTTLGLKPQRRTFQLILRGHLLNHDLARAKKCIQDMEEAGLPPDSSTYAVIVSAYKGLGLDSFVEDRAYEILGSSSTDRKVMVMNGLLRLYLDKHDLEGALRLLNSFANQLGTTSPDGTPIVGNGGRRTGSTAALPRPGLIADSATYSMLIDYLSKHGDPSLLHYILQRMKAADMVLDSGVAAALVRLYYIRGLNDQALSVVDDVCRPFNLDTRLLKHLGYRKRKSLPSYGPFQGGPTVELFNSLMQGVLHLRGYRVVPTVLKLMEATGLSPDVVTLEIFLSHLERQKSLRPRLVIRAFKSLLKYNVWPTLRHLNIFLGSVVRAKKNIVRKEGWNATAHHVKQSAESLDSGLIHSLGQNTGEPSPLIDPNLSMTDRRSSTFRALLYPIIRSLKARSIKADRATFALRMRYDTFTLPPTEAGLSASYVLQQMRDRGLHPNMHHYAALMEAHCAAGNVSAARAVMKDAVTHGVQPAPGSRAVLYTILITMHAREGRPDLALGVFQEMLRADVAPDVAAVDAVVGAFFAVKAFRLARRVLLDLWPMVAPFPEELKEGTLLVLIGRLRKLRGEVALSREDISGPTAGQMRMLRLRMNKYIKRWNVMTSGKDSSISPRRHGVKSKRLFLAPRGVVRRPSVLQQVGSAGA